MTRDQHHAIALARHICDGDLDPTELSDPDWRLLLRAADVNNPRSLPHLVSRRVLNRAERHIGYFSSDHSGDRNAMPVPTESPDVPAGHRPHVN